MWTLTPGQLISGSTIFLFYLNYPLSEIALRRVAPYAVITPTSTQANGEWNVHAHGNTVEHAVVGEIEKVRPGHLGPMIVICVFHNAESRKVAWIVFCKWCTDETIHTSYPLKRCDANATLLPHFDIAPNAQVFHQIETYKRNGCGRTILQFLLMFRFSLDSLARCPEFIGEWFLISSDFLTGPFRTQSTIEHHFFGSRPKWYSVIRTSTRSISCKSTAVH